MGRLRVGLTIAVILLAGCGEKETAGESEDPIRGAQGAYVPRGSGEGSGHHVDCLLYVRVKGRLVDPETGSGCAGAWVLTLPERSWADEADTIEEWRSINAQMEDAKARAVAQGPYWHFTGKALFLAADETTADGAFDVIIDVPWSVAFVGGELAGPTHPPPRHGVEALVVEAEGRDRLVIDIPKDCGEWTEHPDDPDAYRDLWATWDLGTVELKAGD